MSKENNIESFSNVKYEIVTMLRFLGYYKNDIFVIPSGYKLADNVYSIWCNTQGTFYSKTEGMSNIIYPSASLLLYTYTQLSERCISKLLQYKRTLKISNIDILVRKLYNIGFVKDGSNRQPV